MEQKRANKATTLMLIQPQYWLGLIVIWLCKVRFAQ